MTRLIVFLFVTLPFFGHQAAAETLDIDGDGEVKALTDGLLIIRNMFGFTGESLIQGAVSSGCTNCTSEEIQGELDSLNQTGLKASSKGWSLVASNGNKMLLMGLDYETNDLVVSFPLSTEVGEKIIFARIDLRTEGYTINDMNFGASPYFVEDECGVDNKTIFTTSRSPYHKSGFSGLTDGFFFNGGYATAESLDLDGLNFTFFGEAGGRSWGDRIGDIWVFGDPEVSFETFNMYPLSWTDTCQGSTPALTFDGGYIRYAHNAGNFIDLFPPPYELKPN